MAWTDWLGQLGGWASGNPMEAGTLGLGAAGTGLGIYDVIRANQQARDRDFAAKSWLRQNPPGSFYSQLATPESQLAFARPWLADTAASGVQSGGAWTQAVADASAKYRSQVYPQSEQMRLNEFQSQFGPYGGYSQQPSPMGAVGGLGQSLQTMMLLNALRQRQPPQQPGAADTGWIPRGGSWTPEMGAYETMPAQSMMGGAPPGGGAGSFYPPDAFGGGGAGGYYETPAFSGTYGG